MNEKTNNKLNKSQTAIVNASNEKTLSLREAAQQIEEAIKTHDVSDVDALRKMRLQCCNAESRAARSNKVAILSDADATTFALFAKIHNSEDKLNAFFSRAIYVQDKLRDIIRATARNVALSAITRNRSTRIVLNTLLNNETATRKALCAALVSENYSNDTASSQVSSSLIALSHLSIVSHDDATKLYSVKDRDYATALAA